MTMIMAAMGGPGFTTVPGVNRTSSGGSPGVAFAPQIGFVNDGTAQFRTFPGGGLVADTDWGRPTTAGVGSSFWVRFTNSSGTGVYNGAGVGATWNSISAGVSLGINSAGAGAALSRTGTFDIASDAAGVTIVASGTFSFTSDRT